MLSQGVSLANTVCLSLSHSTNRSTLLTLFPFIWGDTRLARNPTDGAGQMRAAGTDCAPVPLQSQRLSLWDAWKMLVAPSQNKIKITLIQAAALEKVDSKPDGMPSHNNLWGFKYPSSEKQKKSKNLTISPEIRTLGEEKRRRTFCFHSFSGISFQLQHFFLTFN